MKKLGHFLMALVLICLVGGPVYAGAKGNRQIQSFSKAKRILMREIYRGHQTTFYCGSRYTQGKYVIHDTGYVPRRKSKSARRLEWEHIQRVLKENDGNISATARSLGMYRRTLQRLQGRLHLAADEDAARLAGLGLDAIAEQFQGALEGAVGGRALEDLTDLPVRVRLAGGAHHRRVQQHRHAGLAKYTHKRRGHGGVSVRGVRDDGIARRERGGHLGADDRGCRAGNAGAKHDPASVQAQFVDLPRRSRKALCVLAAIPGLAGEVANRAGAGLPARLSLRQQVGVAGHRVAPLGGAQHRPRQLLLEGARLPVARPRLVEPGDNPIRPQRAKKRRALAATPIPRFRNATRAAESRKTLGGCRENCHAGSCMNMRHR